MTYLTTRDDIDGELIGTFGSGSTGGGNAVMLAAIDSRVRCAVSQVPIADGADWLRRMRREHEWLEFLDRLDADRRQRVLTGESELVHPREDLMVKTPERVDARRTPRSRTDTCRRSACTAPNGSWRTDRSTWPASSSALMVVGVADDPVTPTDHCTALYQRAPQPKKLIIQGDTTHYAAYEQYASIVIPEMVAWFSQHLTAGPIDVREDDGTGETQRFLGHSDSTWPQPKS